MRVFARGGGKTTGFLLASIFAFALAETAQAADRYWKGGGSDTLWSTSGNWKDNAAPVKGDSVHFRNDQVSGGFSGRTVTLRGAYTNGVIHVSNGSSESTPIVFNADQDSSHGVRFTDDGWLGYHADGGLWLKSGTYTFAKSLNMGVAKSGTHNFWLKVGDGSSTASLTVANHPTIKGASKFVADNATLDFTGKNFNMYGTSSANIKDATMTAAILNVAVDQGNNCTAVFNGGSLTLSSTSKIGYGKTSKGYMYATNLTLNVTGSADLWLGSHDQTGATGVVDKKGGDWTIGGNLVIGAQSSDKGTFTTDGGSVTVSGNTKIANGSGSTGTLTIKNGTFTTKGISATGTATLDMDGCTLKAGADNVNLIDSGITVKVGANGATIDTASCAVTNASDIGEASGAPAALAFAGGGKVTLSGAANWTGGTTVNAGTALAFPAATKSTLVTHGITVAIPETGAGDGVTVLEINDGNGTFSSEDIAAITLTGNSNDRYALVLADEGAKVAISDTLAGEYVWNGGSSGDSWRMDGRWSKNGTPGNWYDSTAAVFENAGDFATVDAAVAAASVTFRENTTVGGTAALTVSEVAVSNGVSATINAPTAGALEKTGTGTLTLGSSRSDVTTLSEGTLVMSGSGTTLDWLKLTQGTDVAKPVTVKFEGGATFAGTTTLNVGDQAGMTASLVKEAGDWTVNKLHIGTSDSSVASFYHNGGAMVVSGNFDIGQSGSATSSYFEIAGGVVTNSGYYIHLGANSPGVMTVKTGGKYVALGNTGLIVGGNNAGTLNVEGGDVLIYGPLNLSYRGGTTAVNVTDGGLLAINKMLHGTGSGNGVATIALNNGTIRANAGSTTFIPNKANITVKVGANGGTIDVNSKTITLLRPILEDAESTGGGMTFKGGGVVTLASGNTYTGITTVEVGTTVHVAAPSDIGGGLSVTVSETAPADGVYTLVAVDGAGTFTDAVLTGVVAPANATLRLSSDGKSVVCIYGNPVNTWVGGATGSLSETTNWSLGAVPQSGDSCVIGNLTAATLTVGDTFAPSTITFPADTALVTISGERALSGLTSIVNNSSQHHVIACPVDASAATPTLPLAETNYLVFSGGIALNAMPSVANMRLAGVWNLTGDWTEPPSGTYIASGSTITVSGMLKSGYNIELRANATLQVATARANLGADGKNRFLYKNYGTFIVTGEMQDTMGSANGTYGLAGLFAYGNNEAVVRANGIVHAASTKGSHIFKLNNGSDVATNTVVLGSGGLSFSNNTGTASSCYPYFQIDSGKAVTLASSADWSFGANSVSGKDLCLELVGSVTVDTSDYDDRTVPHIVKATGRIGSGGTMTVTGCGRLEFEHYSDFYNLYVQDTATVACNAECSLSRTAVNVASGATFEVAQSGTVTLGGNLTLANNATLAFNFTERGSAPTLEMASGKTVTAAGAIKVAVSGVWPKGGSNGEVALTSGGVFPDVSVSLADGCPNWAKSVKVKGGNLVLEVKSFATMILVR